MEKTITFTYKEYLPITKDALDVNFHFNVIDSSLVGAPEEKSVQTHHVVKVTITRTLAACWGLEPEDRDKVMFEYGKRHVIEKIKDGNLGAEEELWLSSYKVPSQCPFDPARIENPEGAIVTVRTHETPIMQDAGQVTLAGQIIDARDNINALFFQKYKEKLIVLVEERDLLQFFREATTHEEFVYRITALKNAACNLNKKALTSITSSSDPKLGTIALLEKLLSSCPSPDAKVITTLRHLNRIRQCYPVHGDRVDGVIEAHEYFKLPYPVVDYQAAWRSLLVIYLDSLKRLLLVLNSEAIEPD
jgi:hypothetical protein